MRFWFFSGILPYKEVFTVGKFAKLFKKVGGWDVLKQYARAHVLFYALTQTAWNGLSKKSLELVRLGVTNKILSRLRKQYRPFIRKYTAVSTEADRVRSNKVWVCWLQGMTQAPALVQRCYASLQENLPDREIVLLTEENYRDFVTFPPHIQEKIDNGTITKTHMSDLLRLELLIRHGGTWVDATVFCSGNRIPAYMLDSDLFVFQKLKPGADGHATVISSWFMTACTNHPILLLTRALLYEYWKKYNHLKDYFLLHDFFQLAIEAYPQEWAKVVPFSSSVPHILLLRMFEPFDPLIWEALQAQTCFHKLSYKAVPDNKQAEGSYYETVLDLKF